MYVITLLLGAILFLPNYAAALEDRLQSERKFEPLEIYANLKLSTKASKPLAYFGIILCITGVAFYITSGASFLLSSSDKKRAVLALILIWSALISGHLRAYELSSGNASEKFYIRTELSSSSVAFRHSLLRSLKDMAYITALICFIFLVSKITLPQEL